MGGLLALVIGAPSLLLLGANASGGGDIDLDINNDGIEDLFVTVYDMNSTSHTTILEHERVNGFATVPILASADAKGRANVSWNAIGIDVPNNECGHGSSRRLDNHAVLNVHVSSSCGN
jgi:hypothetical protein